MALKLNPLSVAKGKKFLCEMCGKGATLACQHCRVSFYCGKEHQSVDWFGIHEKICQLLGALRTLRPTLGSEDERQRRNLTVHLSPGELARVLDCHADRIDADELILTSPFRMRRRGVELKLHLGDVPSEVDRTLVQNIVKAQRWMAMLIDGKTFSEIAQAEGTSKRRVQDVVDLAMLEPDILDLIAIGEQPDGLNSDYLIKSGVPAAWTEQRKQFAKL